MKKMNFKMMKKYPFQNMKVLLFLVHLLFTVAENPFYSKYFNVDNKIEGLAKQVCFRLSI